MKWLMVFLCALFIQLSTPVQAQNALFFQGPWNVFAQPGASPQVKYRTVRRGKKVYRVRVYERRATYQRAARGMPPANARCGWYMGRLTGHTDRSLWLAQNWARKFPRTSARPGAVVVWSRGGNRGHVAKIVSLQGSCRAVVQDNRGTYSRDICRGVIAYVSV